ncbi:MAG TPA: YdcH family protein [Polyangiaceae bacterium]|nr:YdcH family protein [Polyangiaceae bacterium]
MVEETIAQRLSLLEQRHRDLKNEVARLERRAFLSPDERRQITDLKKLKLSAKDEIQALRRQL